MNWLLWQSEAGTKKMIGGPEGRGCKLTYMYVCIRTCTIKLLRSFPVIVVYTDILLYKVAKKCNLTCITKTLS